MGAEAEKFARHDSIIRTLSEAEIHPAGKFLVDRIKRWGLDAFWKSMKTFVDEHPS